MARFSLLYRQIFMRVYNYAMGFLVFKTLYSSGNKLIEIEKLIHECIKLMTMIHSF